MSTVLSGTLHFFPVLWLFLFQTVLFNVSHCSMAADPILRFFWDPTGVLFLFDVYFFTSSEPLPGLLKTCLSHTADKTSGVLYLDYRLRRCCLQTRVCPYTRRALTARKRSIVG